MRQARPNLFLIGAMKSGTSYLRRLLGSHPSIFMCDPDEPSYFVDPKQLRAIWPDMWRLGFWRSEENYLKLFEGAAVAKIIGEASTNYTKAPLLPGVAQKIQTFNPNARLIYLLRDPIERTISHYWHMVRYHGENRSLIEAVKCEAQFMDVSHYAMQLAPYLELFSRDRIAILTHEELVLRPAATMSALYSWLGVDPSVVEMSDFGEPENVTPDIVGIRKYGALSRQVLQALPLASITPHIPQPLRITLRRLTRKDVPRRRVDTTELIKFLRPIQMRQTERLAHMLGRAFPEWTTLYEPAARTHRAMEFSDYIAP